MSRRSFIATAGVTAGTIAGAPAILSAQPQIRWRMTSGFPKSLDTIFGGTELIAKRVASLTGGRFVISTHAAGEIVPGPQALDAASQGNVEIAHTASYFFWGRNHAMTFGTCLPFGLNARQHAAWWQHGGGEQLFNTFTRKEAGVHCVYSGQTGAQMGGWFRREVPTPDDLKGLKFRIGGYAGQILQRMGAVPQQVPPGDIYPALEKGTIDAAEFVGPYDDEKLGLNKIAKFYYYPGFWEGSAALNMHINVKAWEALPAEYRSALEVAGDEAALWMLAKYDALNAGALRRLVAGGAVLRGFSRPIMDLAYKTSQEVIAESASKNADFKALLDSYTRFQRDVVPWFRVTENTFDDYMASALRG